MTTRRLLVREGRSELDDASAAVAELQRQIDTPNASLVLFFCSSRYDLQQLGPALSKAFSAPIVGCTSAGQLGAAGYAKGGITAVSLESSELRATPFLISQLGGGSEVVDVGYRAVAQLVRSGSKRAFGLLLIDGLANAEERVAAALFQALGDVPLIGGSAADELAFQETHVYFDGQFRRGAAVFVLFETTLPFVTFKVQDATPTPAKLVATSTDPARRLVFEINGKPAVTGYAEKLGVAASELTAVLCAQHPPLVRWGSEYFIRGVRAVNADGSLSFWCAVEEGIVLTLGRQISAVDTLTASLEEAQRKVGSCALMIGLESVTRRVELEQAGQAEVVGALLARHKVVGFSTYGEQFDSMHLSQSFTGVALGGG